MGFPNANRSYKQKPVLVDGVFLDKAASGHSRRGQCAPGTVKLKVGQLTMLVTFGNTSRGKERLAPRQFPAIAAHDAPARICRVGFPTGSGALRTNCYHLHGPFFVRLLSSPDHREVKSDFDFAPDNDLDASGKTYLPV
jgi:hypothetical protein